MPGLRSMFAHLRAWLFEGENTPKAIITGTRALRLTRVASARSRAGAPPDIKPGRKTIEAESTRSSVTSSKTIVAPQTRRRTARVRRDPTTYWQDKGWIKSRDTYNGFFSVNGQRWPGVIKWHKLGLRDCHISNPPAGLWEHLHASCFSHIGKGKYSVHFTRQPQTVDAAIVTVERILAEATGRRITRWKNHS